MARRVHTLNFRSFTKTILLSDTLESLSSSQRFTTEFELFCGPGNAGNVFIGESDDFTWIPRTPGSKHSFGSEDIPAEGKHFDLNKILIRGTAGDTVIVQYREKT